jgi:nitrite reductase/ring-hydroxylating ferredoxin subunit
LTRAILKRGGRLFGQTRAVRLDHDAPISIELEGGHTIFADNVVIATNTPFSYVVAPHIRQAAYRSYVIALEAEPRETRTPAGLWWDMESPFHYVRTLAAEDGLEWILVGGEDHKTGQAEIAAGGPYARLEAWARRNLGGLGPVVARWSGQIMESMDGLGLIGRMEHGRNVFVATGDSGNGMTHGAIAAMLISDLICDRVSRWSDVYDPTRLRLSAMGRFAQENLNVARHYADWVTYASGKTADDIPRNCGAVIRRGLSPVAVFRDGDGELHERSAVCPHLGCIVAWNSLEATWDCPCHGSRFNTEGSVLNGPANRGLAPAPGSDAREDAGDAAHDHAQDGRSRDDGRAMRMP